MKDKKIIIIITVIVLFGILFSVLCIQIQTQAKISECSSDEVLIGTGMPNPASVFHGFVFSVRKFHIHRGYVYHFHYPTY